MAAQCVSLGRYWQVAWSQVEQAGSGRVGWQVSHRQEVSFHCWPAGQFVSGALYVQVSGSHTSQGWCVMFRSHGRQMQKSSDHSELGGQAVSMCTHAQSAFNWRQLPSSRSGGTQLQAGRSQ